MNEKIFSYLGKVVDVRIDRPMGTKHPKYEFVYPVNYGHLPGTVSGDGEEIDVYILKVDEPLHEFRGKCIAVIHRSDDNDDKLIVIPKELEDISDAEIKQATDFQEQHYSSAIVREFND